MLPLDLGETLEAAFRIVRAQWRTLAVLTAVVVVPVALLNLLVTVLMADGYERGAGGNILVGADYGQGGAAVAGAAIGWTLSLVGDVLATLACYRAVTDTFAGRPTSVSASLRFARDRLAPALWVTIIMVLGVLAGCVACLVPGIWLLVAWAVAVPVLLVEGRSGTDALRRSAELVKGRWWATFARLVVAWLLVGVASGLLGVILSAPFLVVADDGSLAFLVAQTAAETAASVVTTPFIVAVTALVYFDLRERKGDLDLDAVGGGDAHHSGDVPPGPPAGRWLPPVAPEQR